jgi:hypothetical protein
MPCSRAYPEDPIVLSVSSQNNVGRHNNLAVPV